MNALISDVRTPGNGLLYVPAVVTVSHAFEAKRPIALGLAASGSAVGGTALPMIFRSLTPLVGLGWTNRIIGSIILAISIPAVLVLDPGASTDSSCRTRSRGVFDRSVLKDIPYLFLCGGLFLVELGFWITPYALLNLHATADYAFYLLAILNAGGFAGRVLPPFLTQIKGFGSAWILFSGCVSLGILVLCWLRVHNLVGMTIWAVLVGFMSGITVSFPNSVLPKLSAPSTEGARSGMMWTFVSFAALVGAPVAGALTPSGTDSYRNGQIFSGLSICLGSVLLCIPAIHVTRKRLE